MKFDVYILDYLGSTQWIEPTIQEIKNTSVMLYHQIVKNVKLVHT